jgi:hypothetical protein
MRDLMLRHYDLEGTMPDEAFRPLTIWS